MNSQMQISSFIGSCCAYICYGNKTNRTKRNLNYLPLGCGYQNTGHHFQETVEASPLEEGRHCGILLHFCGKGEHHLALGPPCHKPKSQAVFLSEIRFHDQQLSTFLNITNYWLQKEPHGVQCTTSGV